MKTLYFIFLMFFSWWGFLGFAVLGLYNLIPGKWYILIPCFILSILWAAVVRNYAEDWRKKHY